MKRVFLLLGCLLPLMLSAQNWYYEEQKQGIRYDVEPNIEKTQRAYTDSWRRLNKVKVFVVQVSSFSGESSSSRAQTEASNLAMILEENGSKANAYVVFQEPAFKVRVGDFTHRAEAYGALKLIQTQYPGAFVTTDIRKISEIAE